MVKAMKKEMVNSNLNRVVQICYELLEVADRGDKFRNDTGCGVVYGRVRDAAYMLRKIAENEISVHQTTSASATKHPNTINSRKRNMEKINSGKEKTTAMDKKKRILVVDDEQDVRSYLIALFEDNGYETLAAKDGIEGFKIAKAEKPDLISLDIAMPDQSGVRTYRQYKKDPDLKDIPVIIITAVGDNLRIYLKKVSGFPIPEGFMNKPIDPEELIAMTKELLDS